MSLIGQKLALVHWDAACIAFRSNTFQYNNNGKQNSGESSLYLTQGSVTTSKSNFDGL